MKAKKLIINGEEQELVSSVNGQTGDVEIAECNTKTFFLENSQDITTAQAAIDRLASGGNSIINYEGVSYILAGRGMEK